MINDLFFDPSQYEVKTCELDGHTITYRAFEGLAYCTRPADPIQTLNLFVPEAYYHGETINGYDLRTVPIFGQNTVGGYAPGAPGTPGRDFRNQINAIFAALEHGYVVASAGIRGRSSDKGTGKAPALIVDMKAAIRYLRHNRAAIPGNVERIITNGASAGGALSALAGATGNSPDYADFLRDIGAADERDDVFAASCYCPIHNLDNADAAYEWQFCGCDDFHGFRLEVVNGQVVGLIPTTGKMSKHQIDLSHQLKAAFPAYLNSLGLKDSEGNALKLDEQGEGSFKDFVKRYILASAQKELDTRHSVLNYRSVVDPGIDIARLSCFTTDNGHITAIDWDAFIQMITRMKTTPAFDHLDLSSVENEVFGNETISSRHFTAFACQNSEVAGAMADSRVIRMINPIGYISAADTAKHWRIRHGAYDRDTSLAIPVILATLLQNNGYDVDLELPWGVPHSGDYDLPELFAWIDQKVKTIAVQM